MIPFQGPERLRMTFLFSVASASVPAAARERDFIRVATVDALSFILITLPTRSLLFLFGLCPGSMPSYPALTTRLVLEVQSLQS